MTVKLTINGSVGWQPRKIPDTLILNIIIRAKKIFRLIAVSVYIGVGVYVVQYRFFPGHNADFFKNVFYRAHFMYI